MAATSNLTYKNELITSSIGKNTNIHPQNLKTADTTLTIPKNKSGKKKPTSLVGFFFQKTRAEKTRAEKTRAKKKNPLKKLNLGKLQMLQK